MATQQRLTKTTTIDRAEEGDQVRYNGNDYLYDRCYVGADERTIHVIRNHKGTLRLYDHVEVTLNPVGKAAY